MSKMVRSPTKSEVSFTDLHLDSLQITVDDLIISMDTVRMNVTSIRCVEKSGFDFGHLTGNISAGKTHLYFNDFDIVTPGSDLNIPVVGFNFEKYRNFKHFSREVDLTFQSDQSILEIDEFSNFVPGTRGLFDHIAIDGNVHGKLSDMRGEELFVTFDQNTTLAFDFVMIGLPEFSNIV